MFASYFEEFWVASSGQMIQCVWMVSSLPTLSFFPILVIFFFSLKVSVDCIPLYYLMSKSCLVPWQPPSFPQVPISHSPHILHSLRRRVLCPPPHPGTSQNSPVTPYVLVPCLHFPPSPPPPLPTLYLPPALHSTLCFTLACLPPKLNEFFVAYFPQNFLVDLWCGLIQLSSLSLAKNRDKMDDANHHKNGEHCSNEHSKFRSKLPWVLLFILYYLFIYLINLRHHLI